MAINIYCYYSFNAIWRAGSFNGPSVSLLLLFINAI